MFRGKYGADLSDDDDDLEDAKQHEILKAEFHKEFSVKSDHEKLKLIAQNTLKLYKKAIEFDNKMLALDNEYNFLAKDIRKECERLTEVPSIPNGLVDPGTH